MALNTYSKFYFGHTITIDNQLLIFQEDGDAIYRVASLNVGGYSLEDFCTEIARAMNEVGGQVYECTVDRFTRLVTISSVGNFSLIVTDPDYAAITVFSLAGFTTDRSGANSYEGDVASGQEFIPQYKLQKYVDFEDNVKANASKTNTSASGVVEVIKYGSIKMMEANIIYQTDKPQVADSPILNDPNGVSNLRNFLTYAITKAPLEFMPDKDDPEYLVTKCILESTQGNTTGTGFKLSELYGRKLLGYFETKKITFREV